MTDAAKVFSNVKHGQVRGSLILTSDSLIFQGENNGGVHAFPIREFVDAQIGPSETESIALNCVHTSGSHKKNQTFSFENQDDMGDAAQHINQRIQAIREANAANVDFDVEAQRQPLPVAVAQPVNIVQATTATAPPPTAATPVPPTAPRLPYRFRRSSTPITCPHCQQQVQTQVNHEITGLTMLWGFLICLVSSLFLLCCLGLLPCMMPQFQETKHTCPNCHREVATVAVME
jgi:LITAF-like zinc ribbon domain